MAPSPPRVPQAAPRPRAFAWRLPLAVALGAAAAATLASPAPAQPARPAPPASSPPAATPAPPPPGSGPAFPSPSLPPGLGSPALAPWPQPPPPGSAPAALPPPPPPPAGSGPPAGLAPPAANALPPGGYPYPYYYPPPAGSAAPPGYYPYPYPYPAGSAAPPGYYPYPYPYPYARPAVVPPAATTAQPDEMDDSGQPVPAGYRRVLRVQRVPLLLGTGIFGALYVYSVNAALSSDNTSDRWLLVPVFGPLLDAHDRSKSCTGACPRQSALTLDFSLQAAGVGLLLAGFIGKKPVLVKEPKAVSWSVTPAAGPSLRGLLATGEF